MVKVGAENIMLKHMRIYTESEKAVIDNFFAKLAAATTKTGKISESKKAKIINSWQDYPPDIVISALEVYIKMDIPQASYGKGKNEKYVLGIIRNKAACIGGEADKNVGTGKLAGGNDRSISKPREDEGARLSSLIGAGRTTADELDCDF